MQKMQAIGAPFLTEHSSNSDLKPKNFDWTTEDFPIKVFIDGGIGHGLPYQKKTGEKKIGWVCESRSVFHSMNFPRDTWEEKIHEIASFYDILFTSEKEFITKHPNIRYCPAGSNLPWTKKQDIFQKTKLVSMLASSKKFTFGHMLRHSIATKFKDNIDLYGGVLGTKKIGLNIFDKSEAMNDYMFSIVVENDKYSTYYTEKLTDCFATGTIPIYWGAPDIGNIFNLEGIIELTPEFDLNSLTPELYQSKMSAIQDNFARVQSLIGADDQLFKLIHEN